MRPMHLSPVWRDGINFCRPLHCIEVLPPRNHHSDSHHYKTTKASQTERSKERKRRPVKELSRRELRTDTTVLSRSDSLSFPEQQSSTSAPTPIDKGKTRRILYPPARRTYRALSLFACGQRDRAWVLQGKNRPRATAAVSCCITLPHSCVEGREYKAAKFALG
ncbi:hypothetical protein BKA80DRAFT_118975 [Phyllosticta citrichinensis]